MRALLSVSDKTRVAEFARGLAARGIDLVSTGGTARTLTEGGLRVIGISEVTGFPEMMDGRVKTLHPAVHGGILARRHRADDLAAIARHGITPIDLVVVNLYPFARAAARADAAFDEVELQVSKMDQQVQDLPQMDLPSLDVPMVGGAGMFIGNFQQVDHKAEGDIIPVVVIRPMYPREAAMTGTEGWVKVEFTITEVGTVKDPRVIDANPPRIFNREAIRAILKWKFKPRVVEGVAVERRATQVIDFTLDENNG